MIRKLLEFLISCSFDKHKTPAGWLQRLTQRDRKLRDFNTQSQQLDAALRSSAIQHRQAMTTRHGAPTLTLPPQRQASHQPKTGRSIPWRTALATAAVLLVALSTNWLRPATSKVHATELSQQLTTVPGEVLELLTRAAKTSQAQLPRLSPLHNLPAPLLPNWQDLTISIESPVYQRLNTLRTNWQNIKFRPRSESFDSKKTM